MDLSKNIAEAEWALREKPLFSTTFERVLILDELKDKYTDLPQPRRFSRTLSTLLSRVSVPLESHDLIAGRIPDRELTAEEEQLFENFVKSPDCTYRRVFLDSGHCSYDWGYLIENGLPALKQKALESLEKQTDEGARDFLRAAIEVYDTIIAYLLRYAKAAHEMGNRGLADALTEAACEKPHTFRGALQLCYTVAFIDCAYITRNPTLTLGRLDVLLYPLYQKGLADGTLTREQAAAYITDFYCKHNLMMGRGEHQNGGSDNATGFHRNLNFDAPQYLHLAGTDKDGKDACNDLTELFASLIVPSFKNPVVVVRYYVGMAKEHPRLWQILSEKALDSSSLMFYNENNVMAAYERLGIPREVCRDYYHFGCNWASPTTRATWLQGGPKAVHYRVPMSEEEKALLSAPYTRSPDPYEMPETFVNIMRELAGNEDASIDVFYDRLLARFGDFVDYKLRVALTEKEVRQRNKSAVMTFGDCFFPYTIERAGCASACADYFFELLMVRMFGTLVDCVITVDELVFRQKKLTLRQLLDATDADFVGYEDILALCRRVPKYGSDSEHSNAHAARLSKALTDLIIEKSRPYTEKYGVLVQPAMQSDTWHLKTGEKYGATPNGRRANTPFSQNSRPSNGSCTAGLTGMLHAMLELPHDALTSGALNLDVQKSMFADPDKKPLFGILLSTYLDGGGLHAQVSVADVHDLLDAQKNPELYRDLSVRVTGYSGIFVDLCEKLQNDVIERMKG